MATDYTTSVVSRIGTIALIAIGLMGSDRKGLEAAVPLSSRRREQRATSFPRRLPNARS
jgi:hypothetical protein